MSKPKLYYAPLSPPARGVLLTAAAIGIEFDLIEINLLKGEHLTPEFLKLNPQHTIPVLVDTDGSVIYDSHAISCYLVDKYGREEHQSLYPKDLVKRAQVQAALYFDAQHLFARCTNLYAPVLFFGYKGPIADKVAYIQASYECLDNKLKVNKFVAANHLTLADFAAIASITSEDEVAPVDGFPNVVAWMKRMYQTVPFLSKVNDPGAKEVKEIFKAKYAENQAK